jgi:hypothetical protein
MRAKIAMGEINRFPCGRRAGGRNRSLEERAQAANEKRCEREYRRIARQTRADRRARRQAARGERKQAAELDRRREQFHAGLPSDDAVDLVASDPQLALKMEACFEAALAFFREHRAPREVQRELARHARMLIKHLNSPRLPPYEAVEKAYHRLVRCEEAFGRAAGDPGRLDRLYRAYDNYLKRRAAAKTFKQVAMVRAVAGIERLPVPVARPIGQNALGNQTSAPGSQTAGPQPNCPPHLRELQRAYELSNLIVEAGRAAGRRFAGERVEPERRLSIAPWLAR